MELREVPLGATFRFSPSAEKHIEQVAATYSHLWAESMNPYRVKPDDRDFILEAIPDAKTGIGMFTSSKRKQREVYTGLTGHFRNMEYAKAFAAGKYPYGVDPSRVQIPDIATLEVELIHPVPEALTKLSGNLPSRDSFTTSCDPEIFLEDGNGNILPAFDLLPKQNKIQLESSQFYRDGFAAEMSPSPRRCHQEVIQGVASVLFSMLATARSKAPGAQLSARSFVEIPDDVMAKAKDSDVALGCERSENIYGVGGFTIDNPRDLRYRMAGGHIHLGSHAIAPWLHKHAEPIIRAMDAFCGVPSVALFAGIEDPRRRSYYGRAGEFRFQKHGLEYRTLSNAWMTDPMFAHLVFNMARGAFRFGFWQWEEVHKIDFERVQHIINDLNVPEARRFCEEYRHILRYLMNQDSGYTWDNTALALIQKGVVSAYPAWADVERNWSSKPSKDFEVNKHMLEFTSSELGRDELGRFVSQAA